MAKQTVTISVALLFLATSVAEGESPSTMDYSPMWSLNGERIVFSSSRSGDMEIYVMSSDGSGVQRLTHQEGSDGEPSWSPDGTKIAFCSGRDGNDEIYLMDSDGGDPVNLTNHPASDCSTPSWSPDGRKLTFVSTRDGDWRDRPEDNYEIYVMNADGSDQRRLTHTPGYDLSSGQAWTPDGKQVIFCSSGEHPFVPDSENQYAHFDIYRIDADGTDLTRLTYAYEEDSYPFVSPDGLKISYSRHLKETGTFYDLYSMTADGRVVTRVTDLPGLEGTAAWSPDGSRMVYAATDAQGNYSIYTANPDGSGAVKLTNK